MLGAGQVGAGHGVRRLAAHRHAAPRQALADVAPDDLDLLPRDGDDVGGNARQVDDRVGAEVADSRMHLEPPVGAQEHQPVEADRPGAVRPDGHADAARLGAATLPGPRQSLGPAEELGAAVEGVLDERAGDVAPRPVGGGGPVLRLAFRRVDAPHRHLVDLQLLGRLGQHPLDDAVELHRPGRALLGARRRVGEDVGDADAHCLRLVDQRRGVGARAPVAHRPVRPVVLDDEEIHRLDTAVLGEAEPGAAGHVGAGAAEVALLFAAHPHHHRRVDLLRQDGRDRHRDRTGALAAESAAGVLADEHDLRRVDADPARHRFHRTDDALRGAVQVERVAAPVGHGATRLHRVMPGGVDHERLVEDQRSAGEAGVEVAVLPFLHRPAGRQLAVGRSGEVLRGPLEPFDRRPARRLPGGRRRRNAPDIAFETGVRPAGAEALERIDGEWQRLEIDGDELDRLGGDVLAVGRQRQDRLALVERFVGQGALGPAQIRQVVGGDETANAGQRQGARGVDAPNPGVRHRADEQLAEQHALGPEVLGIAGAAGDLGHQVRSRVVRTDEAFRHVALRDGAGDVTRL